MRVIIMGCGRVGEQLARLMSEEGHDVAVIDYDATALARLGPDFKGRRVQRRGVRSGCAAARRHRRQPTALRR